jgi:Type II secretion system (T2SS), protein M subtype b
MIASRLKLLPRLAALAILAVATAVVILGGSLLFGSSDEAEEGRARSVELLASYQRIAAQRPAFDLRLAALKRHEATLTGIWRGASSALAAAALRGDLQHLVEAAGGQVRTAQDLPPTEEKGFGRVGARLDLTVPAQRLPSFLQALAGHEPYFFLDKFELRAPETVASGPPQLTLQCEITLYWAAAPT